MLEEKVRAMLEAGLFFLSLHAEQRVSERRVTTHDLRSAGRTAWEVRHQPGNDTYRVTGTDEDGDTLVVVVAFRDEQLVVVTAHPERS